MEKNLIHYNFQQCAIEDVLAEEKSIMTEAHITTPTGVTSQASLKGLVGGADAGASYKDKQPTTQSNVNNNLATGFSSSGSIVNESLSSAKPTDSAISEKSFHFSRDYSFREEPYEDWSFVEKRPYDSLVRESLLDVLNILENQA